MAIQFQCGNAGCGKVLRVADSAAGRQVRCPHCGQVQAVPGPAEPVEGPSPFEADPGAPAARRSGGRKSSPRFVEHEKTYRAGGPDLRRYRNLIIGLLVLGALVVGVMWTVKQIGKGPVGYIQTVVETPKAVESISIRTNLGNLARGLQSYQAANGQYPPTLERLAEHHMVSEGMIRSRTGTPLGYISGQTDAAPQDNVIAYEEQPGPDGQCFVLRLDGSIASLSPEQLQQELARTRSRLNAP